MARNRAANSGPIAIKGFKYQRNCALYLILRNKEKFLSNEFFVCIEHHDDFLFCFLDKDTNELINVDAYQAKLKSKKPWTTDAKIGGILAKMLEVGTDLNDDPHPKKLEYEHSLSFISNQEMLLSSKSSKGVEPEEVGVDLFGKKHQYNKLDNKIKENILSKIRHFNNKNKKDITEQDEEELQLDNVEFCWVDFPKTSLEQVDALAGIFGKEFPNIQYPNAAVNLLLELFSEIEDVIHDNGEILLSNKSKRVEGSKIKEAFDIVSTKQKTYKFWREQSEKFTQPLDITWLYIGKYEHYISEVYEKFKDKENVAYQQVRRFVAENNFANSPSIGVVLSNYKVEVKRSLKIIMDDVELSFVIICAFVEHYC